MRRVLFAAAFVLTSAVATADDPKPAPPAVRPGGQPTIPPRPLPVTAARMAQLEEDLEVLVANRAVKAAHVKAAELGVRAAEIGLDRMTTLVANAAVPKEELDKAKVNLELAKVQVLIREAELKEVEVKVKYAKKRLDDAKALGVRPLPVRPVPVDPLPQARGAADAQTVEELYAKLEKTEAALEKNDAESIKATAKLKVAEDGMARIMDAVTRGIVAASDIRYAEAQLDEAKALVRSLQVERAGLLIVRADLRAKLKEIDK